MDIIHKIYVLQLFCYMKTNRRRVRSKPPPFKSKVRHLIIDKRNTIIFLLVFIVFGSLVLLGTHGYWRKIYTMAGQGYAFEK
jgi:hypothetical protein